MCCGPRNGKHPMLQKDGSCWTGCFSLVKQPLAMAIISKMQKEFKEGWYLPSECLAAVVFFPSRPCHNHIYIHTSGIFDCCTTSQLHIGRQKRT